MHIDHLSQLLSRPRFVGISAAVAALAAAAFVPAVAGTTTTQAGAAAATVFVAPPAAAGLGTHGSDSDSANCKRFAPSVPTPPSGVGYGCASFQQAYQLAKPGDTVYLNWSGAWPINQLRIGPSGNKSSAAGCLYPVDVSGCVNFTPAPGLSPSLTPASSGSQAANLGICADYVELSNVTFNGFTYVDGYGDTVSDTTWGVGAGDNSCQPGGGPPHDVFIDNVISNGPIGIVGGAYNVYVLGGAIQNAINFPPQFGAGALVNGTYIKGVHDSTIDGVSFSNITGTDPAHHHMDCLHMDGSGDRNTVRNSTFSGPSCMYQSIRVEAETNGSPVSNYQTHVLIENNVFDVPNPLGFDCHDSGCMLTNNVVRFNTFKQAGFMPTNDCAQVQGRTCTQTGNSFYGNVFLTACPSNAKIYGLGWTTSYDVTTQSAGGICTGDTTSAFNAAVRLNSDGSLSGPQAAVDFVPVSVAAPALDRLGRARPQGIADDAGAFELVPLDTTPPVVTVPPDSTHEATSADGAAVTFAATASDPDDQAGPVTCQPASGSVFAIGTTAVTCTSTDTHGNTGSASFRITVVDTTPPTSPQGLAIADGTQQAQVSVSWSPASDAIGVKGYTISLDGTQVAVVSSQATSASVTGLGWGSHQISVQALDTTGNASQPVSLRVTSAWR